MVPHYYDPFTTQWTTLNSKVEESMSDIKGRKVELSLTNVEIIPFFNNGAVQIQRWLSPFQIFRYDSVSDRIHHPSPKYGLIHVHNGMVHFCF